MRPEHLEDGSPPVVSLAWEVTAIPESSPPVLLARLRPECGDGWWVLVRFPAGWSRPGTGWYQQTEEFWVLEGSLSISGVTYQRDQAAVIPADSLRRDSRSEAGALALARFSGQPRWVRQT